MTGRRPWLPILIKPVGQIKQVSTFLNLPWHPLDARVGLYLHLHPRHWIALGDLDALKVQIRIRSGQTLGLNATHFDLLDQLLAERIDRIQTMHLVVDGLAASERDMHGVLRHSTQHEHDQCKHGDERGLEVSLCRLGSDQLVQRQIRYRLSQPFVLFLKPLQFLQLI